MRRYKKVKPITRFRWADYQVLSDGSASKYSDNEDLHSFPRITRRTRFAWKAQEKIGKRWFKQLVKYFGRSVFDIGPSDFGVFVQRQRFAPRAQYLLKNKWINIQFGIYLIEYTVVDNVAYSFYSLNYGVRYVSFMGSELTDNRKLNMKIIINLFKETEEFLHQTLADRKPPYIPTYLFR